MDGEPRERWDLLDLDRFPSPSRRGRIVWTVVVAVVAVFVVAGTVWIFLPD
jgi:hypothetical protein